MFPNSVQDTDEGYTLTISQTEGVTISANEYSGYVRALATLTYLID